jgi:hypothetical protein
VIAFFGQEETAMTKETRDKQTSSLPHRRDVLRYGAGLAAAGVVGGPFAPSALAQADDLAPYKSS